jgi:hypothetical protein
MRSRVCSASATETTPEGAGIVTCMLAWLATHHLDARSQSVVTWLLARTAAARRQRSRGGCPAGATPRPRLFGRSSYPFVGPATEVFGSITGPAEHSVHGSSGAVPIGKDASGVLRDT